MWNLRVGDSFDESNSYILLWKVHPVGFKSAHCEIMNVIVIHDFFLIKND